MFLFIYFFSSFLLEICQTLIHTIIQCLFDLHVTFDDY